MRILYNARDSRYKMPFGTLREGERCCLSLDIPRDVSALRAEVIAEEAEGREVLCADLLLSEEKGDYQRFSGEIQLNRGLYFYYFRIFKQDGSFRLFKQGQDTNMEAGERWQVSVVDRAASVPDWAKGAVIYQIFPDRFCRSGQTDLSEKLQPFRVHDIWGELPDWRPNAQGEITNNDFFGGNFRGIQEKLPFLRDLGVELLYLNPIVKAWSNHRYDTADYRTPDPMLGTEADFSALCDAAHSLGMKVILDGVFSHTGNRALYFEDAVKNERSPYRDWYRWHHYPDTYDSWWGITTLPCLNKENPGYLDFLIRDADSVVVHWLRLGADGWRLDVVDELPDEMVLMLKRRIREVKPDALLMGEVWEDASNKVAYGRRRRYFVDGELDSVMNYPLKSAILSYVCGGDGGLGLRETVETLAENYPKDVLHCCMSLLSTHDTARALTVLGGGGDGTRAEEAVRRLSPEQRWEAVKRLKMASFLQFTLPGAPSIYYGDEAGLEGGRDPFNRQCYPWGREDHSLLSHFQSLCRLRREQQDLRTGDVSILEAGGGRIAFRRGALLVLCNRSLEPWCGHEGNILLGHSLDISDRVTIGPGGFAVLKP